MTQREKYKKFMGFMDRLKFFGMTHKQVAEALRVNERSIYKWIAKEREIGPLLLLAIEKIVADRKA